MRRFVLGTAGHVDHGKTTLVRALTGVDTDRLPEEKRRGITIELGFAQWKLDGELEASVIDVPGHKKLVHAMIAGAQGMELLLLVVAADEGVMPQTREHVAIAELLGIERAVVAVTKCDRVDAELAAMAEEEAAALVRGRMRAETVRVSAQTGEGLDALRAAVAKALRELPAPASSAHARLSVDRVFAVRGAGTVVTGTLTEGRIAEGAPLFVVGRGGARETAARGLQVHDAAIARAEAPTRLAINLAGLAQSDVKRGDVVTTDARAAETRMIDVVVGGEGELPRRIEGTLHVGTSRAAARADAIAEPGPEGEEAPRLLRVRLAEPVVIAGGDRFLLRGTDASGAAGAPVWGGRVLDAAPARSRVRERRRAVLRALAAGEPKAIARALAAEAEPRPIARAALGRRFPVKDDAIARAADALAHAGELARLGTHGWIARGALERLARTARALVAEHEAAAPLARGMPLETLRERLTAIAGREAAEEAIRVAHALEPRAEAIVIEGDVARRAVRPGALDPALERALDAARRAIEGAEGHGLSEFGVREATGVSATETKAVLAKLRRDGAALPLGDLWFSTRVVDEARRRATEHLAQARTITVIEFKNLSGLARKQAILMLEHFDRAGVTRREGDVRRLA